MKSHTDLKEIAARTVSKEMRVRMEGLVKIMAMVRPASGLKLSSCSAKLFFTCETRTLRHKGLKMLGLSY